MAKKQDLLAEWYRKQIKEAVPSIIDQWAPLMGVNVKHVFVQHMKTKWGSCNPSVGNIRLNSELAKKPRECLEFIVVHEMVHMLEPTHNPNFIAYMDRYMPQWEHYRDILNRLPVRHEHWLY